jgi:phosphoglycolate phosphatase-like HAD superfamily hydrolase
VRLVLFDIDGTLVDCGRQTRAPFAAALVEVFGETGDLERYDFSGRTDPGIVHDLLTGAGRDRDDVLAAIPAVRDAYLARLDAALAPERMRLLPGIRSLLERLERREDVVLALLTGNWERGARIKLSRHDLNRFFPFGSFGDGRLDRNELPPVAWERARERTARTFPPEETLIVGDSLLDVACARAHGIPCLAVATGWTEPAALAAAGADWVLADLEGALEHEAFGGALATPRS